jgi:hypothetical protein
MASMKDKVLAVWAFWLDYQSIEPTFVQKLLLSGNLRRPNRTQKYYIP